MSAVDESTCIEVGGMKYCNVTVTWTPRVSETGGLFAVIIPTLYTVVMFGLVFIRNYRSDKAGNRKTIGEGIVDTYRRNKKLMYIKDYACETDYIKLAGVSKTKKANAVEDAKEHNKFNIDGERIVYKPVETAMNIEDYIAPENTDSTTYHTSAAVAKRYSNFNVNGRRMKIPDPLVDYKKTWIALSSEDFTTARNHRKIIFGCITLPRCCGLLSMLVKLIVLPIFTVVWDMVDVYFDTYYFYQLERGGLIDRRITRNTRVNNSILAFGVLGAVKSTFLALCMFTAVAHNEEEGKKHVRIVMITMFAVATKILFEDGPEVILEYFFVDKFITDRYPPWYLVAKDIVTALIYVIPLIKVVTSGYKDYKKTCEDSYLNDNRSFVGTAVAFILYVPATLAKTFISAALIFRV